MYSEVVNEHFRSPRHVGELTNPDGVGVAGKPGQGNYMIFQVCLEGDCISQIGYLTFGCPTAIASGSLLSEMVRGRAETAARAITPEELLVALGGLPLGKRHCPALAIQALRAALDDARTKDREQVKG